MVQSRRTRLTLLLAGVLLAVIAVWLISSRNDTPTAGDKTTADTGQATDPRAIGDSRAGEFVPSINDSSAVVWAVGDGDANGAGQAVVRLIEPTADRLLYIGDVYKTGTARDFAVNFDPSYGRLAAITAPTPGDHEFPKENSGYLPYWEGVYGHRPPAYYSFEAAGWTILSLNSEVDHAQDSAQIRWLDEQLATPGTCRIAFWHRPLYNAGTIHSGDEDVETFWQALRGRASIVLNGNEHSMQRFEPSGGVTEFIVGTGGYGLYPLQESPPSQLAFGEDQSYGALRLNLSPGNADYAFVDTDGRTLDSGHIGCNPQ